MSEAGSKIVRIENLPELLSKPLENETGILDALLVSLAKGQHHAELWQRLHDASLRDDRLAELAFAYERVTQDRRIKIMPPQNQAIVALHNYEFFAECFGDLDGAIGALERALAAVPGHPEAFAKLVDICQRKKDKPRLIALHLQTASPKADKETQLEHLRRALAFSAELTDDERTVKIAQQILKLDPSDGSSLAVAENRLLAGSKFSEIAKMLEQAAQAGLEPDDDLRIRGRLVELYDTKLAEIEKAMPHVEELLSKDPTHEGARKAATKLLGHKVMAPRAAAALERVYEAEDDSANVAKMLTLQVDQLRGPKKTEAQKRLALLYAELDDPASALAHLEAVVLADLGDEEARMTFVAMSLELDKAQDAARVLSRAAAGAKEAPVRGRINAELGRVFVVLGDLKRAKQVLANVIDTSGDDLATLAAARAILPLYEEGKEAKQIAATLEKLAMIEPHPEAQGEALLRLALVAENDLGDATMAIAALRRTMEVTPTVEVRDSLERLLEASGRFGELADSLEGRAKLLGTEPEAREMLLRAARLREEAGEPKRAVELLAYLVETFGPAHDVHDLLIPLLVAARMTPELLATLAAEAQIVSPEERPPVLARIAQVKAKQKDTAGALEAYAEVLALAPDDPGARQFVEAALKAAPGTDDALRLRASDILLPIYDASDDASGLVSALAVRSDLLLDPADRLEATKLAFALASKLPGDMRAAELAQKGLTLALDADRELLPEWVDRTGELEEGLGVEAVMQVLTATLDDGNGALRAIDDASLAHLARATGRALRECGDAKRALEVYRALLVFEPQNNELLATVDGLLEEQGSPADRVKLYEVALERHQEPARRRELFHKIGAVQRRDLSDVRAAIGTYKRALDEFADDKAFRGALYASYEVAEAWDELYAALASALATAPPEDRAGIERRLADVSLSAKHPERASAHFRAVLDAGAELAPLQLDAAERLALEQDEASLLRFVLERRLTTAETPDDVVTLLERLGDLEAGKLHDPEAARQRYMHAARAAEPLEDPTRELSLHRKVLAGLPGNKPTLARVIQIARATGDTPLLVESLDAMFEATEAEAERISIALSMEAPRLAIGDVAGLVRVLDKVATETGPRLDLMAAKARAYGDAAPSEAAAVYRSMLADLDEASATQAAGLFEAFLEPRMDVAEHREDARVLFGFRAKQVTGESRRRVLFSWAEAERTTLGSPARALTIARELLALDPNDIEALELETAVARSLGDFESAARSIERRAGISEGDAKRALYVELSEILMKELGRAGDALDVAEDLLRTSSTDPAARRILERALETPAAPENAEMRARAGEMLERLAADLPTSEERVKVYEDLLVALEHRSAGLYKKLLAEEEASPERALGIALRAVGEFPEEEELWSRSEDLARTLNAADRVSMAYRQVLAQAANKLSPEAAMTIGERGVNFQEEWFDDPDAVAHMLKLIVDVAPAATWAFERLKLLYNAGERWEDLFLLYDRVIQGTSEPGAKVEILEDAAQVAKDLAGDPERAMGYLEELHKLEPQDGRTTSALERLYERHAKHKPLIGLLAERVPRANASDKTALRLRMAGLHLDGLGELEEARVLAEAVLADDAKNADAERTLEKLVNVTGTEAKGLARLRRSVKAQERKGSEPPSSLHPLGEATTAKVRRLAALSLKARYVAADKAEPAVRMIDVALEEPSDDRDALLRELVELEKGPIGDRARAFETLVLLAYLSPANKKLRKELTAEADALGNHARFVDALTEIAERCTTPKDALPILEQASAVAKDTLKDEGRVISIELFILARTDQDPVRAKEAAAKLDRQLARTGREAERCGVLERLAELETDVAARGKILHEVARIAENVIGDPARAARALRQRLVDEADDIAALSALIENLRAAGELAELAEMLARRVEILEIGEKRRSDLVELARLRGKRLGDRAGAIAAFDRVIEEHGADDEVADELADELRAAGDEKKLAVLLNQEATRAKDASRAASLFAALGEVDVRLDEKPRAAEAFAKALDQVPSVESARVGLEGLLEDLAPEPARYAAGVAALERAYRATNAWEKSLGLVPARLRAATTDEERAVIHMEAADLEEQRGRDPGSATASNWKAFTFAPEREGVASELLRRTRLSGRWDLVAPDLLVALQGKNVRPPIARDLLVEASDWALREDATTARALALLTSALERAPGDVEALARLVEAHRRSPSKALCDALIELAHAYAGRGEAPTATLGPLSIECLREAVTVARKDLADGDVTLSIAQKLREESARRWEEATREHASQDDVEVCRDAVSFAIDNEVDVLSEAGDNAGAYGVLVAGATLPFDATERRSLRLRATAFATSSDAIDIYRALFDEDPHDVDVARELESRYLAENRRRDIIDLRKKQVDVAELIEERLGLRLSLASLHEEMQEGALAEEVLALNLREAPTHDVSVGYLARLFDAAGKHTELASLWESQARALDGSRAIEMWDRTATLRASLGDLESATQARKKIVDIAPTPRALDDLAKLLEQGERFSDAAAVLERLVETLESEGGAEEAVILRLASDYEAAGRRERALAWLERRDGPNASAELRTRLRVMYRALSMLEPLAALLAREAESAPDPKTRVARLKEAAAIFTTELNQPERAIPLLEELLDLDKTDLVTRLLLSDALRVNGRFDAARDILKALLDEYGTRRPKERALVHFELAKVWISLEERPKAMAELEAASKIDQSHPGILHMLATLALAEGQLLRAQRTFRALLLVVRPQRTQAFAATPSPETAGKALETPISRAEVLVELAAIAEKQDESDRKAEFIESAFEAARESSWEAEQLTRALGARGWHDLVVRVLESRTADAGTPFDRAALLLARAEVLASSLDRTSEALDAALAALDLDPTSHKAHERALTYARGTNAIARYAAALRDLASKAADQPLLSLDLTLFEARAKAGDLGDHEGARDAYRGVLDTLSDLTARGTSAPVARVDVLHELETVLEKMGDKSAQIRVVEEIIELGAEAGRSVRHQADMHYKLATLHLGNGESDAAVDALEQASGLDPEPDRVEAALRAALPEAPKNLRMARLFEDFCRGSDRKPALVDALVAVADREEDPRPTLREAYELAVSLGDAGPSEELRELLLVRIVDHAADSEDTAWALTELGSRKLTAGDVAQGIDLLERSAKVSAPDDERALLMRIAKLAEERLKDDGRAIAFYEQVRSREPADREVWGPLLRIYERLGRLDALAKLIEETIPLVDDLVERAAMRVTLAEHLLPRDPTRASELLREALDEAPDNPKAGKLLSEIYTKSGDRDGLASLYEKRLDAAKDKEDKTAIVALSMELGKLREEQGDDTAALEIYNAALDWNPDSRDALRAIVALGMKRDDSVGIGDELEKLMTLEEGQAAIDLAFKVAEMKRAMGDEAAAERALLAGMKAHPTNAPIRAELRKIYTQRGAQKELTDLEHVEATTIEDPAARKAALLALAARYKETLADEASAGDCLVEAHQADPTDRDVLFALMDTLAALGEHQKAVLAVDRAIAADTSGDASWFYFSRAVLREATGDGDGALQDLEEAQRQSGGKYGSELRAHLEAAIGRAARDPKSSSLTERQLRLRLAEVMAEVGDGDAARAMIGEVLAKEPQDRPALRSLARIDETSGNDEAAVATLRRLITLEEGDDLVQTALRLARAADRLGQPQTARQGLERALRVSPQDASVKTGLKAIYIRVGDLMPLAAMIVDEGRSAGDDEVLHARLLEAAQHLLVDEAHAPSAFELLAEAHLKKPDDVETQLLIADAHTMTGRPDQGAAIAQNLITGFKGRRSRELGRAHYSLYRARLRDGNLSEALEILGKAFENDPQNARMARELGELAVDLDDADIAQRAFRSITLMKPGATPAEGPTTEDKSLAYFHLGRMAIDQGDRRRAKLMLEKALSEDPGREDARELLGRLA